MKKHFANVLSMCRIIIASVLLWYSDITAGFLRLFCLAGLTDLLDGPIARLTNSVSELGSKLDTYGDVLTYTAIAKILLFKEKIKKKYLVIAVCAGAALLISAFIGLKRFGTFFFIHTISGKLLGLGCFLLPFSAFMNTLNILAPLICLILIVLALESLIIQLKSTAPNPDTRSIFSIK